MPFVVKLFSTKKEIQNKGGTTMSKNNIISLENPEGKADVLILLSKSGHQESEEYNHFWRCSVWERNAISIQKSTKLKQSV